MVCYATILHCKAILGRRQLGLMRRILVLIMPLVQDRSLDLLTSTPGRDHCTTDAPSNYVMNGIISDCALPGD